ncbi:unnamed protein product [Brassica rapa subsp. trilocularis]
MEYSTFSFFQIDSVNRTKSPASIEVQHRLVLTLLLMITFLLVSFNIKGRFSFVSYYKRLLGEALKRGYSLCKIFS